ncbi:DUF3306 domain-containing protein [Methylophaga sp. OBS3]|uniref:DUF3306 domain-containing protein n=1 Tax=Methylophaga sp. OBS3 TaxID=2991934 RepID=UPI002259D397|nr:DUF3306 domain-containing protein [Methylophaga sp. OBS3]MCX4190617.1 DUF3306 domain-containing protein [Methylophaga sp. OBS3]
MADNEKSGFFSRWSARKLEQSSPAEEAQQPTIPAEDNVEPAPEVIATELVETESPTPAWQNPELDAASRKQALRDIFRKPGIGKPDGLDEYENDYNYQNFASLGDVVTHEMRRMLDKQIESLVASAEPDAEKPSDPTPTKSEDDKLA